MSSVSRFVRFMDGILPSSIPYNFRDKSKCISDYVAYMLSRTQSIFKWEGLPDTIPQRILELYLQINGNCVFYEHEGSLYIFTGGLGGEPDVYYQPTVYTIANPALNISKELKIDIDCILARNDALMTGLLPLLSRCATSLVETDLSINIAAINSRIISLISATDDRTYDSATEYLKNVIAGNVGVVSDSQFFDSLKTSPYAQTGNSNIITNLIELYQYQKASWYNDIGLNANYNMKRESINSGESQLNDDALLPFIDNMMACRQEICEKVNEKYGLDLSVSYDSAWEDNELETEKELENLSSKNSDPESEELKDEVEPEKTE